MRWIVTITLLLLCAFPAHADALLTVADVPNPRERGEWVADTAGVISEEQKRALNLAINAYEYETGVEIAVVTADAVAAATPKDFATQLFNYWGIGKKGSNNGLLILLVVLERRVEMETGYGLEGSLTDGWLKKMQGEKMVPHFKKGEYGEGLVAGTRASIDRLREIPPGTPPPEPPSLLEHPMVPYAGGGLLFLVTLLGGGLWWARREREEKPRHTTRLTPAPVRPTERRSPRTRPCPEPGCHGQMKLLSEDEEDAHLTSGQQSEEELGSVQWDVYQCRVCSYVRAQPNAKYTVPATRCPSCESRTFQPGQLVETIDDPNRPGEKMVRTTDVCAHCGHETHRDKPIYTSEVTTPSWSERHPEQNRSELVETRREREEREEREARERLGQRSTAGALFDALSSVSSDDDDDGWSSDDDYSGGSSGGSFGGGSSGGGGAGSSW